jgi:Circularly permutated YpsA SLOG family
LRRIVSGGQSGVDRAALDAARALGIPAGGWCPRGRIAEDGCIRRRYRLVETPSRGYAQRTEWNVRDSDATLIVNRGRLDGGTLLTVQLAQRHRKPVFVVQLGRRLRRAQWRAWLARSRVRVLNVAGPRESKRPGIYREARAVLSVLLAA